MEIRLQKWLSMSGACSRRKAEELITSGRVSVNGAVVTELGAKANTQTDLVELDGKAVEIEGRKRYIMLHKPEGVVTTVTDPFGRTTVMDLVPKDVRLYPVGRLDYDTTGLILMTNDGQWAQKLTHPKNEVTKTYIAVVRGVPTGESLRKLAKGVEIEIEKAAVTLPKGSGGKAPLKVKTAPATVKLLGPQKDKNAKLMITIREGRNRQVRKMCEAVGHKIINLKRVSIGKLELGDLPKGKWRELTAREVKALL